MNNLPVLRQFDFEGHDVRVTDRNGDPWFVLADVCRVLGIGNPRQAATRLKDRERSTVTNNDSRAGFGAQSFTIISEAGLYRLLFTSRAPAAVPFQDWLAETVLPAIRKTGGYVAGEEHATTLEDLNDRIIAMHERKAVLLQERLCRMDVSLTLEGEQSSYVASSNTLLHSPAAAG